MISGICYILGACFCWGLLFVVPQFLMDYSPIEIALGRYLVFGIISLFLLLPNAKRLLCKERIKDWGRATWYAFLSTIVSFTAFVLCMRYASVPIAALNFGMSPIAIALVGNWIKREYPFRIFLIPIIATGVGILCVNISAFGLGEVESVGRFVFGVFCGVVGLASWTAYVIGNAHFFRKNTNLLSYDWVTMMGTATLGLVLVGIALLAYFDPALSRFLSFGREHVSFLIGAVVLGVICSWLSFYFWNRGSKLIPVTLAGQLLVFEMVFGLFFVYLVDMRLPSILEFVGIASMLFGVRSAFRAMNRFASIA